MQRLASDGSVLMVEAHGGSGGPPTTLLDLAPELSRRRRVTVAIPPGRIADQLAVRAPDIQIVTLPRWEPRKRMTQRLRSFPRLAQEVGRHAIIHANGKSALNLVAPAVATRVRRPPMLVHFHDFELTQRNTRVMGMWGRLGLVSGYAPVSDLAADLLAAGGLGPILGKLPNPVPGSEVRASPGGPPYSLAYVGSRDPRKGLDLMMEIAGEMRDFPCRWHVYGVVVGGRLDRFTQGCIDRVGALGLSDRVVWEGRRPGLMELMATHHALLLPPRRESFCRVAIEAMAAGLPVVASNIPGLDEAVGEGNCLLFELDDPSAAASALESVVTDRERFLSLQRAGLARAEAFSPPRVCDLLEGLYELL